MRKGALAPAVLLVPGLLALAFLVLPLVALLLQAPWGSIAQIVSSPEALQALRLSLVTSLSATAVAAVLGIPLAWLLARDALPGTNVIRALVVVPLLMPPVVSGVALLAVLGRRGVIGQFVYGLTGFQFPFTTAGVIVAEAFVAMPFLVITLEAGLRGLDREYEEAAVTLGASTWQAFRRVTLPLAAPAAFAGLVLCWARAVGEFGATITFAGSFPGTTQTMPLAVYAALEQDRSIAIALSVVLIGACLIALVVLRGRYLRQ